MASGKPERAMADFYKGLVLDPEHLPLYESLGYSLWALNGDSLGALSFADSGLKHSVEFPKVLQAEYDGTIRNYEAVSRNYPTLAPLIQLERNDLSSRYAAVTQALSPNADKMNTRLKLQFAYYSALELTNESTALDFSNSIYRSKSKDAEYEDSRGFVLMRFASGMQDLYTARGLFEDAVGNASPEHVTPRLANIHLEEVTKEINCIKSGKDEASCR